MRFFVDMDIDEMFDGELEVDAQFDGEYGEIQEVSHFDYYSGEYTVTPLADVAVVLPTEGLMMSGNVTINPVPSNYGLITWNGATLTVS